MLQQFKAISWGHFLLAQKTGLSAIPLSLHPPRRLRLLRWIASLSNALAPIPCPVVGFEKRCKNSTTVLF